MKVTNRKTGNENMVKPPSNRRSKEYKRIIKLGCGGYRDSYYGDYDCSHEYDWSCENCPINRENKTNPVTALKALAKEYGKINNLELDEQAFKAWEDHIERKITVIKPQRETPRLITGNTEGIQV